MEPDTSLDDPQEDGADGEHADEHHRRQYPVDGPHPVRLVRVKGQRAAPCRAAPGGGVVSAGGVAVTSAPAAVAEAIIVVVVVVVTAAVVFVAPAGSGVLPCFEGGTSRVAVR